MFTSNCLKISFHNIEDDSDADDCENGSDVRRVSWLVQWKGWSLRYSGAASARICPQASGERERGQDHSHSGAGGYSKRVGRLRRPSGERKDRSEIMVLSLSR